MIERLMGPSWDLSAVYQGTGDPLLETDLALLERNLGELSDLNVRFLDHDVLVAQQLFLQLELAEQLLSNLETYANCRLSVDSGDETAQHLFGSLQRFQKQVRTCSKPRRKIVFLIGVWHRSTRQTARSCSKPRTVRSYSKP